MPVRRSAKSRKRQLQVQKTVKASETMRLPPADSPLDGDAADDIKDDSIGSGSSLAKEGHSQREQQMEYVEKFIQEVEKRARGWCDTIMDDNDLNIRMQMRTRDRVKDKINPKLRHTRLAELCEVSGNDLNATLLMAVSPEERAVLLAEGRAGGQGTDEEDGEEEELPTAVKGRNPPRMVPATPKGGGRPAARGRVTRSVIKGPRESGQPSGPRDLHQPVVVAQTPTGRGRAPGRVMRSAVKGKEAPAAAAGSGVASLQISSTLVEDAPELPKNVIAHLQERFQPDCTVWQCLDIVFQPKIEELTRHAEAACAELRQNIAEQSKQLRAKIAPADNDVAGAPSKKKKVNKAAAKPKAKGKSTRGSAAAPIAGSEGGDVDEGPPEVMAVDETEEEAAQEEEVGEEQEIGGTAKVSLSIKGGPYDGSVFEIFVEEDGDARLVGRSTGKKFKNHGISLRRDSEVSITHGMFMNSGGVVTFMDNGSTNGTEVDGEWVEPKKAYEMFTGSELQIGQSRCTVAVTWER